MLHIINDVRMLDFPQMNHVYYQSILQSGKIAYPRASEWDQVRCGEELLRESLLDFFRIEGALIALWSCGGHYVSALRLEPYLDGYLLSCLETAPDARRNGYATELVRHVLNKMTGKIYSHVQKTNDASMAIHRKNGFLIACDYAKLLDGTISHRYYTLYTQK